MTRAHPAVSSPAGAPVGSDVARRLRDAGLAADNLTARRAALPEPVQALHAAVLQALARTGRPPSRVELAGQARALDVDLPSALAALADSELLFTDPARTRVLGGVPFAAAPTAHQVRIDGGPTVSANCALDALGIAAMLDRDTEVRSADPLSAAPITATARNGQWRWEPPRAVVFVGSRGAGRITDACCPVINFFTSPANALSYQQRHGLHGQVLSLPEAAVAAALLFADLIRTPTDDEEDRR